MAIQCNFPGCPKKATSRGLCPAHYWQATKSAAPSVREKAAGCMSPSTRKGGRRAAAAAAAGPPPADLGPEIDEETGRIRHDEAVAAVHEFALTAGMKGLHFDEGILYANHDGTKAVWVDRESGRIEEAHVHKGANKVLIV